MISEKDRYFLSTLVMRFNLKKGRDNTYRCDCIVCGDSKSKKSLKRMYFIDKNTYVHVYCHNCGYSSNLKGFIQDKAPDLMEQYNFYGFKKPNKVSLNALKDKLEEKVTVSEVQEKLYFTSLELNHLTKCFSELQEDHPARLYVERREIPFKKVRYSANFHKLIQDLNRSDVYEGYPIPCMIIPFFRSDDHMSILQARFFDKKVKPKYLTVKLDSTVQKIYNADFVDYSKEVLILEGPLDSMFVDNAIAMAGSDALPPRDGKFVYVYDNEPHNKEITSKILQKIDLGFPVVIWKRTDKFKDINEAIMKKIVDKKEVNDILKHRIKKGLNAKLEFALWRGK